MIYLAKSLHRLLYTQPVFCRRWRSIKNETNFIGFQRTYFNYFKPHNMGVQFLQPSQTSSRILRQSVPWVVRSSNANSKTGYVELRRHCCKLRLVVGRILTTCLRCLCNDLQMVQEPDANIYGIPPPNRGSPL